MQIYEVKEQKREKAYLDLLLLADESEAMIDRYLERGKLFALEDHGIRAVCVLTDEGGGVLELKNLAVHTAYQRQGYGRRLVEFAKAVGKAGGFHKLLVGTGDSPLTIPFYEACGFLRSYVVKDFFTENYDHPIYDAGVLLTDMIYLEQDL